MKLSKIKPRYFALFSVIMALWMMILYWREVGTNKRVIASIYADEKYIAREITENIALPANAKFMKYTTFYNRIINHYSEKPQSGRGMNRYQKSEFATRSYNYETWLGLPRFYFVGKARIESDFNPNAKGKLGEEGIFNIMPTTDVIGAAFMALVLLRIEKPWLAKKLEFDFNIIYFDKKKKRYKIETNLRDPLNSLKIKALCAWYYQRKYRREEQWWIPADHWGETRIYHLWRAGVTPPEEFRWETKDAKEAARNPMEYFFVWDAYRQAFSQWKLEPNIEKSGWIDEYLKECSRLEAEFVEHWRDVKKVKELEKVYAEKLIILDKEIGEAKKIQFKHRKQIIKLDKQYMKYYKLMKAKKYKDLAKEIFLPMRIYYAAVKDEITKENNKIRNRILAIINIGVTIIIIFLAILQIMSFIRKLFKKIF